MEALDIYDQEALALYRDLAHPVVRDLGLTGVVFDAYGLSMTRDDVALLMGRLRVVHEYMLTEERMRREDEGRGDG